MKITVSSIRQARPEQRINLLLRYVSGVGMDDELTPNKEMAALYAVTSSVADGIALDKWFSVVKVPVDRGYNAYDYIRDYYGLDAAKMLSMDELREKYPKLLYRGCPDDEKNLESWYNSITVQIMARITDEAKSTEQKVESEARIMAQTVAKDATNSGKKKTKAKPKSKYSFSAEGPKYSMSIFDCGPWVKRGKLAEFYDRKMERILRLLEEEDNDDEEDEE